MLLEDLLLPGTSICNAMHQLLVHLNLLLHGCLHKVPAPHLGLTDNQLYFLLSTGSIFHLQKLSYLLFEAMTGFTIPFHQCNHLIDALLM